MKIDFNGFLYALSYALDCEERELVGVAENHAKWVAYVSARLGKKFDFSREQRRDLAACAALHDNALTQYVAEEKNQEVEGEVTFALHCVIGEENVRDFPFCTDVAGAILYHHENADGSGPLAQPLEETPVFAQIIHLADYLDANCRLKDISEEKYDRILYVLNQQKGSLFSEEITNAFLRAMPKEYYLSLKNKSINEILEEELPTEEIELTFEQVQNVIEVFAKIIDYKSTFTRNHSIQIAKKAYIMADYYGYDEETKERLFVAGALHDIGKMAIDNDVLEKPDKLTDREFIYMQNHAWFTHEILARMKGFEDITRWASYHHEKLNGKGYPFGKTAEQLDEKERLMGCIDIYQALSEDRPYKPGMKHEKCMEIMSEMAEKGFIDGKITKDIDRVFQTVNV